MITTLVGSPKRGGNFYVTADDPRGPWSDPIWLDSDGFDPSLLFADGEVYYLRDGKGPTNDHPRVYQARIDPAMGTLREPMRVDLGRDGRHLAGGRARLQDEGALLPVRGRGRNGVRTRRGRRAQRLAVRTVRAVAAQPDPVAPRSCASTRSRRRATSIWWSSTTGRPGRCSSACARRGAASSTSGARRSWRRCTFSPDGWPMIGDGGRVELRMPAPALPPQPPPAQPARDDFDHPALTPAWNFVRNPNAGRRSR